MTAEERRNGNSEPRAANRGTGNLRVVVICAGIVAGMGAMAYAAVPLYQIFCQVTGYGGTTRQAANNMGVEILDREVTVRFDANTSPSLDWEFYPAQRSVTLRLGEQKKITYFVENHSDRELTGTATFNVTPQAAGAYFNKIECFCFTETKVKAGEKLEMPVVFFVDPDMVDYKETAGFKTLTLSYTFFPDREANEAASIETTERKSGSAGG